MPARAASKTRRRKPNLSNPRVLARLKAGLSPEEVAKKARICVAYYKQVERTGNINYDLALDLCRVLDCRVDIYL